MTEDEWRAFLTAPVRPAVLSTVRADGTPHAAPIWYAIDDDDGAVVFNTGADTVKGRNLRRTPTVSLCVQDDQPPYAFCIVEGRAEISVDLGEVRRWATVIGGRYMGADRAEEFGARNGVPGETVVRVPPTKVVAFRDIAD
ncbi:MAG: PPOX class F420-dependent oxidoreductase [Acidimicrobiales bacterium]